MTSPVELWQAAAEAFDNRFKAIGKEQWGAQTPCSEWTVHDLVTHAVGVQAMFGGAIGAAAPEGAKWDVVRAAMAEALAEPGALDGSINHPALGEMPKAQVIGIATNDLLIHTWDLARAIGADETLPAECVDACHAALKMMPAEMIRVPGRFADPVAVGSDADRQAQMLAFAGRKP